MFDADPDVVYLDHSEVKLDAKTLGSLQDLARITGFIGTSDRLGDLSHDEGERLVLLLTHEPRITRRPDMQWTIDGRDIDFGWLEALKSSAALGEVS